MSSKFVNWIKIGTATVPAWENQLTRLCSGKNARQR